VLAEDTNGTRYVVLRGDTVAKRYGGIPGPLECDDELADRGKI